MNYWSSPTPEQQQRVEEKDRAGLAASEPHLPPRGLATLAMPPALAAAHAALDRAVDKCYRPADFPSDRARVEYLFQLYEQLTAPLAPTAKPKRSRKAKGDYAKPPPGPAQPGITPEKSYGDAAHFYGKEDPVPYRIKPRRIDVGFFRLPRICPTLAGIIAGMNESLLDLEMCAPWLACRSRRPGPVGQLFAAETRGTLLLRWSPPRGSQVESYLIERTRDGREYERVAETDQTQWLLPRPPLGEAWFYRVRACNARGAGGCQAVYLYERRGWSHRTGRGSVLQYVLVIPGLRVNVCELVPG